MPIIYLIFVSNINENTMSDLNNNIYSMFHLFLILIIFLKNPSMGSTMKLIRITLLINILIL